MFTSFHFFCLLLFYNSSLSLALRPLSVLLLLFVYHPPVFFWPLPLDFFKPRLLFISSSDITSISKCHSDVFYIPNLSSIGSSHSYLYSFPDFNGMQCRRNDNKERKATRERPFQLKWESSPCWWFMIKILKNLSFICFL